MHSQCRTLLLTPSRLIVLDRPRTRSLFPAASSLIRRMPMAWLSSPPTLVLRRRLHWNVASAVHLTLHVLSELDVLMEAADMARNFLPRLETERYDRYCIVQ